MTFPLAIDIVLALLVLGVAGWTIATREMFSAAAAFVTFGLLVGLVWVRLAAVDVALTETAIGGGMTGVLLLTAAARLRHADARDAQVAPRGRSLRLVAGVLCAAVAAGLAAIVLAPADRAPTLAPAAIANLPATGLGNAVAAVLLAYRAWDTLLEKVVLVLALVGVWSLAPDSLWGGRPVLRHRPLSDGALVYLAQVLPPVGIVFGIYIVWAGADQPGGAFQGGTILGAMWLLVMMAGLADPPPVSGRGLRFLLIVGAAVFLAVGLAGFVTAKAFLAYPEGYAKPLILLFEGPLTLSIAATLALLVAGPPTQKPPR
jgi:multisubunit Na+/H+ antiporter MnhB subunit